MNNNYYSKLSANFAAKALLVFCLTTLSMWTAKTYGQVGNYAFTNTTSTYAAISGTALLTATDDGISAATNIGFNFNFGGTVFTQFKANSNGWLTFTTTATNTTQYTLMTSGAPLQSICVFDRDLVSTVQYLLSGVAPNRILTVQWNPLNSFSSTTVPATGSCQIKLYETTNVVEMNYSGFTAGTRTLAASVQVGLIGSSTATTQVRSVSGTTWPAAIGANTNTNTVTISTAALPDNNRLFRFAPVTLVNPNITSFSPAVACPSSTVTIFGSGFSGTTAVSFGGVAASSFVLSRRRGLETGEPARRP